MKRKIFSFVIALLVCMSSGDVFAKQKAPATDFEPDAVIDESATNPLYPAKYTPEYIFLFKTLISCNYAKSAIYQ